MSRGLIHRWIARTFVKVEPGTPRGLRLLALAAVIPR